ncbi:MAG TPA: DUF4405 domain-containing protein [Anaerolineae bacterium]|nr:DUF4405 domain-containing protein [Anaerolineae bacterium]
MALSSQTRSNWLIDALVFITGVASSITGIYFFFIPLGGYQGGRNPLYGVTFLLERSTWDELHMWGGLAMILAAAIHLGIHWKWVVSMLRRTYEAILSGKRVMTKGACGNLVINIVLGMGFLLTAVSGIYFLFIPHGNHGQEASSTLFLFSRTTWDRIHTWAAVGMMIAAGLHFVIHWRWIKNVTIRFFQVRNKRMRAQHVLVGK